MPVVVIDTEHQRVQWYLMMLEVAEGRRAIVDMVAAMDGDPDLSLLGLRGADIHGLTPA